MYNNNNNSFHQYHQYSCIHLTSHLPVHFQYQHFHYPANVTRQLITEHVQAASEEESSFQTVMNINRRRCGVVRFWRWL